MKKLIMLAYAITALCCGALKAQYNLTPAGLLKGARLDYVSASVVTIGAGYGEIMGSYWEIAPSNALTTTGYTLTGLGPTTRGTVQYLYIDRANSSLPNVVVKNSTTIPAWNAEYLGWYNGADRCIGAVCVSPSGVIYPFIRAEENTYVFLSGNISVPISGISLFGGVSAGEVWNTLDITPYVPTNASVVGVSTGVWGSWSVSRAGVRTENGPTVYSDGTWAACAYLWGRFDVRVPTKHYQWCLEGQTTTGSLNFFIIGFKLEL